MTTGRSNKLVGQAGEFLVASELARRGYIATTFTGNVPHYDIVASSENGHHLSVQVKTVKGLHWQFSRVDKYFEVILDKPTQKLGRILPAPVKDLIFVFVSLLNYGEDKFYICTYNELAETLYKHHKAYLKLHNATRPKKWDSLHAAISNKDLANFEDRWSLFDTFFKNEKKI